MLSISFSKTLFWNSGMFSFGCSTVKTLLKYYNRTSAFSVSDVVNFREVSVPGTCKSGTFALVLSLDCVYFQNRFGFDFDSLAMFFSNSFFPFLVSLLIWFRILLYWSFSSSDANFFLIFPHILFFLFKFLRVFLSRLHEHFFDSLPPM